MNSLDLGKLGNWANLASAGRASVTSTGPSPTEKRSQLSWQPGTPESATSTPRPTTVWACRSRDWVPFSGTSPATNSSSPPKWAGFWNLTPAADRTPKDSTFPPPPDACGTFPKQASGAASRTPWSGSDWSRWTSLTCTIPTSTIFRPGSPRAFLPWRSCAPRDWSGPLAWASTPPRPPWNASKPRTWTS